jgi:hypothetical protein
LHNCPCCSEIIYDGVIPTLCPDCLEAGCVISRASDGELGYWNCQRLDFFDDDEYDEFIDDDSYDEYPEDIFISDPYDTFIEYDRWV